MSKTEKRRQFGSVRQRRSGRWQATYTGPDTKKYNAPKTFETKDDAIAFLSKVRRDIELGVWVAPDSTAQQKTKKTLTVRSYLETWLSESESRLKPRTHSLYTGYADNVILPELGDIALKSLTAQQVRAWYAGLGSQYPTRNANAYSLLNTVMRQAVDDELIEINPCKVKRGATKHRKVEPIALSPSEIRALAAQMPERWRALVLLAGFSGLRQGELLALQRGDLHLAENASTVTVRRAVVHTGGKFVVDRPKSKTALRTVPLPESVREPVADHLQKFAQDGREGLVFPSLGGKHTHGDTIRVPFKEAAAKAGHPATKFHWLRHSAATLFAQAGMSLSEHMAIMGHVSTNMSARYINGETTTVRVRGLINNL